MEFLQILFLLLLFILLLVTFLIIHLSKKTTKNEKFFSKNYVWLLLILVLSSVIVLPIIFTNSFFSTLFKETGPIGDTIGGITSPFINGLAAILVYIAFTEQVKANELIREQQYFQHILNEIQKLENEVYKLNEINQNIRNGILNARNVVDYEDDNLQRYGIANINIVRRKQLSNVQIGKATYLTIVFLQTHEMIGKLKMDRYVILDRLRLLYIMVYQENFIELHQILLGFINEPYFSVPETELLLQIQKLESIFNNPDS